MPALGLGLAIGGTAPNVAWSPLELDPMIWLDAPQLALADGVSVSNWPDLSGKNHHFLQSTPSKQPIFRASGIHGKAAVQFDGVDDVMEGSQDNTSSFTFWAVWSPTIASTTRQRLYGSGGINQLIGFYDGGRALYTEGSFLYGAQATTEPLAYLAQCSASGRKLRVNGATVSDSIPSGGLYAYSPPSIGQWFEEISGYVGEWGLMSRVLTPDEQAALLDYLSHKWSVAA